DKAANTKLSPTKLDTKSDHEVDSVDDTTLLGTVIIVGCSHKAINDNRQEVAATMSAKLNENLKSTQKITEEHKVSIENVKEINSTHSEIQYSCKGKKENLEKIKTSLKDSCKSHDIKDTVDKYAEKKTADNKETKPATDTPIKTADKAIDQKQTKQSTTIKKDDDAESTKNKQTKTADQTKESTLSSNQPVIDTKQQQNALKTKQPDEKTGESSDTKPSADKHTTPKPVTTKTAEHHEQTPTDKKHEKPQSDDKKPTTTKPDDHSKQPDSSAHKTTEKPTKSSDDKHEKDVVKTGNVRINHEKHDVKEDNDNILSGTLILEDCDCRESLSADSKEFEETVSKIVNEYLLEHDQIDEKHIVNVVKVIDHDGYTEIHYTCTVVKKEHIEKVKTSLKEGCKKDIRLMSPDHALLKREPIHVNKDAIKLLQLKNTIQKIKDKVTTKSKDSKVETQKDKPNSQDKKTTTTRKTDDQRPNTTPTAKTEDKKTATDKKDDHGKQQDSPAHTTVHKNAENDYHTCDHKVESKDDKTVSGVIMLKDCNHKSLNDNKQE
ncbi:unnamed protein product, partial [Didymodactylos carnosus]